jgi:3D (Asp-Asp-Asp) domain-containing protein
MNKLNKLILAIFSALITLMILSYHFQLKRLENDLKEAKNESKLLRRTMTDLKYEVWVKSDKNQRKNVRITYYNSGHTTADGSKLYTKTADGFGWCAISRDLERYYKIGDTISVRSIFVNGMYVIKDRTNKKITNTIDLYIATDKKGVINK